MDTITVALGALAAAYGTITLVARAVNPKVFSKLDAMKKAWGESAGSILHIVSYSVVPIVVGITLIVLGANGISIVGQ